MIPLHVIGEAEFAAVAAGMGGPAAIRALWHGQRSKRLGLLRLVIDSWPRPTAARDTALAVLLAAEHRAPGPVRDLLAEPMVGAWAASVIRALRMPEDDPAGRDRLLGRFGGLAAVAAHRAEIDAQVTGQVDDGWLTLPTMGRLRAPSARRVRLTTHDGAILVDGVDLRAMDAPWQPLRTLTVAADSRVQVAFDDLDPHRNLYHIRAADRLPPDRWDVWRRGFAAAWDLLTTYAPLRADELATGLHSLVPLVKPDARAARSATALDGVGVVGLDLPASPADFVVALVHEFQHSKLTALLDIVPLHERALDEVFFAPWRADPRPIGGLFQGVYAFLGVADMWRVLATDPARFPQAQLRFAEARVQVAAATATLTGSGRLTPAGRRFVTHLTAAVEALHATTVPPAIADAADRLLAQRRERWHAPARRG